MILLFAVLLGLLAGLIRAEIGRRRYQVLSLKAPWLLVLAMLAQVAISESHHLGVSVGDQAAGLALLTGQILVLVFTLMNLHKTGFWLFALGTLLNLIVMLANHGLMPISPTTIMDLYPRVSTDTWSLGHHLWNSKNIVLTEELTRMAFLADRYIIPNWSPYRVAFSLGDILLSLGAVWFFWSLGGKPKLIKEITNERMESNHSKVRSHRWKSRGKGVEQAPDGCGH